MGLPWLLFQLLFHLLLFSFITYLVLLPSMLGFLLWRMPGVCFLSKTQVLSLAKAVSAGLPWPGLQEQRPFPGSQLCCAHVSVAGATQ